jgi:hypothetical protein
VVVAPAVVVVTRPQPWHCESVASVHVIGCTHPGIDGHWGQVSGDPGRR